MTMISPEAKEIVKAIEALTKEIQALRRDLQKLGR